MYIVNARGAGYLDEYAEVDSDGGMGGRMEVSEWTWWRGYLP